MHPLFNDNQGARAAATTNGVITVVVADDHALFREALRSLLDSDPGICVVGDAASGAEAIRMTRELRPDILLVDLNMPVTSGLDVLREIASAAPHTRGIVLTAAVGHTDVFEALQLGARGVVLKDAATHLLFKSIRMVMAGQYWVGRECVAGLIDKIRVPGGPGQRAGENSAYGLTAREVEMVTAVVAGCSNSDIARQFAISQKTVKHHLTNIFDKLGLSNRLELALFAVHKRFDSGRIN